MTLPLNKQPWKDLEVEMFSHVQGRKDASREWGKHIDNVICAQLLGLTKNRADQQCVYQGTINNYHVIMDQATDDILIGTRSLETYNDIC